MSDHWKYPGFRIIVAWHGEIEDRFIQDIPEGSTVLGSIGYTPMSEEMRAQPLSIRLARVIRYTAYDQDGRPIRRDCKDRTEARLVVEVHARARTAR